MSFPYLRPQSSRIITSDWILHTPEGDSKLGEYLPDWDPAVSIWASASVKADMEGILTDCNLPNTAVLRITPIWFSHGTKLRGAGSPQKLNGNNVSFQGDFNIKIDGILLGEFLELGITLTFVSAVGNVNPFSPKIPGCKLYESVPHRVYLEGEGTRFPVELADFKTLNKPTDAGWFLFWNPDDLHQTILGNVRLYINSSHPRVMRAVTEKLPEDFDIREALRWDTARTLIYGCLENSEFIQEPEQFEEGSVGAAVRAMLSLYFPDTRIQDLRDRSWQKNLFDPKLQAKLKLFWQEG